MEINLLEMWNNMGLPVRGVVAALTLQAIACIAVIIDRTLLIILSTRRSRAFAAAAAQQGAVDAEKLLALTERHQASHLASFLRKGLVSFVELKRKGHTTEHAAELTRRALERKSEPLSRELNRFMNVLASTGSTAPFVGLLGTVLGIIHAFKMIAATGSGGIGSIGSAIGEALIVTGYGLTVAIPVVLLFNWMSGRLASYEGDILNAAGDLLDRLEMGDASEAPRTAQTAEAAARLGQPRGAHS
jgi:biopolymer transport protein ExbB/biopolymer transport protein TolQ